MSSELVANQDDMSPQHVQLVRMGPRHTKMIGFFFQMFQSFEQVISIFGCRVLAELIFDEPQLTV